MRIAENPLACGKWTKHTFRAVHRIKDSEANVRGISIMPQLDCVVKIITHNRQISAQAASRYARIAIGEAVQWYRKADCFGADWRRWIDCKRRGTLAGTEVDGVRPRHDT